MKLLLISNSTNAGEEYLRYPLPAIEKFLQGVNEIVFVPYAAVTFSYAAYEKKVQARLAEIGIRVKSVHKAKDPVKMIREAQGWTCEQVAMMADVKEVTIEKIEAGMFNPSFDLMCRIASVLRCKITLIWI